MRRKPHEPTRHERMAACAAKGDIDGVINELTDSLLPKEYFPEAMKYVREALQQMGTKDPVKLTRVLFTKMLTFEGFLLFRVQHHIDQALKSSDSLSRGEGAPPKEIAEVWLPRLSRIHQEIRDTTKSMANVLHVLELAEGRYSPRTQANSSRIIKLHPDVDAGGQREAVGG